MTNATTTTQSRHPEKAHKPDQYAPKKPGWIRVKALDSADFMRVATGGVRVVATRSDRSFYHAAFAKHTGQNSAFSNVGEKRCPGNITSKLGAAIRGIQR